LDACNSDYLLLLKEDRPHKYPPTTPGVPRLHMSWVEEFLMCGHRFFLRHGTNVRRTAVQMAIGVGGHKTIETDNLLKQVGQKLPAREGADVSVAAYDEEMSTSECTDPKHEVEEGRDLAATCGEAVIKEVSPAVPTPVLVEAARVVTFETSQGQIELAGSIDYATAQNGKLIVRDLKTGKKKKSADYAHGRGQMSGYGILLQGGGSEFPAGYVIDSLRLTRTGWIYEPIATTRTEEDYLSYWQRVSAVHAAIKAGSFPPAAEGSWQCSAKFCEYWATCPYVASRRRHAADEGGDEG
jgi:hypothetical protein